MVRTFGDRLSARVQERQSQIVLGLDPDPLALWPDLPEPGLPEPDPSVPDPSAPGAAGLSLPGAGSPGAGASSPGQRVAALVLSHCEALIDAAGPACVAVKLQLARFEALGVPGWEVLARTAEHARQAGLLTIADGKRGDIDVSARAYAQALAGELPTPLGALPGLGADMVTVNPLMGGDAVAPFVEVAREAGAAVLVLVRTSNPGAADVEDLQLAGGEALWERIAALVHEWGAAAGSAQAASLSDVGAAGSGLSDAEAGGSGLSDAEAGGSGLSDVGAVVGATAPRHIRRARELMPNAVFLLPGIGAQGGRVEDLAPAFAPGRAGGLITASRSIANAHLRSGQSPAVAARAEAERLRELAWDLPLDL